MVASIVNYYRNTKGVLLESVITFICLAFSFYPVNMYVNISTVSVSIFIRDDYSEDNHKQHIILKRIFKDLCGANFKKYRFLFSGTNFKQMMVTMWNGELMLGKLFNYLHTY